MLPHTEKIVFLKNLKI